MGAPELAGMNTALQCLEHIGPPLAEAVAQGAKEVVEQALRDAEIAVDVVVIDRAGAILARCP
jgi:cobalt-precorrin-5B (C1)-methyltransferase